MWDDSLFITLSLVKDSICLWVLDEQLSTIVNKYNQQYRLDVENFLQRYPNFYSINENKNHLFINVIYASGFRLYPVFLNRAKLIMWWWLEKLNNMKPRIWELGNWNDPFKTLLRTYKLKLQVHNKLVLKNIPHKNNSFSENSEGKNK